MRDEYRSNNRPKRTNRRPDDRDVARPDGRTGNGRPKQKKQIFLRDCLLVFMIILSTVGLYIAALITGIFGDTKLYVGLEHPLFASVLLNETKQDENAEPEKPAAEIKDRSSDEGGKNSATDATDSDSKKQTAAATESDTKPGGDEETASTKTDADKDKETATDADKKDTYVVGTKIPTQYVEVDKTPVDSVYYSNPGVKALTTDYPYITVDKSYFDDALFIGDSRVEGMRLYSGLDNAVFYCKEGLFMSDVLTENIGIAPDGSRTTIPDALSQTQFKKIFIMIGINSIGIGNTADYKAQYQEILAEIQRHQPQAIVFINSIMNVTTEKSNRDPVINNVNINDKNVAAAGFANGVDIFYIDVNDYVTNDDGGLIPEYTWDGVHLYGQYYSLWVQCLEEHGVSEESFKYLEEH